MLLSDDLRHPSTFASVCLSLPLAVASRSDTPFTLSESLAFSPLPSSIPSWRRRATGNVGFSTHVLVTLARPRRLLFPLSLDAISLDRYNRVYVMHTRFIFIYVRYRVSRKRRKRPKRDRKESGVKDWKKARDDFTKEVTTSRRNDPKYSAPGSIRSNIKTPVSKYIRARAHIRYMGFRGWNYHVISGFLIASFIFLTQIAWINWF